MRYKIYAYSETTRLKKIDYLQYKSNEFIVFIYQKEKYENGY